MNVAFRWERLFFTLSGTSAFSTSDEFSFSSALFSPSFKIIVHSNYLSQNLIYETVEGTCSTEFLWCWFSLGVSSELLVVFSWRKRNCKARLCKGQGGTKMKPSKTSSVTKPCTEFKAHLVPNSWLRLNPFLSPLQFPPAVALPLLAQMSPRVGGLLKKEQQTAAAKVKEHWRKPNN